MHLKHLRVKEDSLAIVPASTQRFIWPSVRVGMLECPVVDESRCLGYHICCSGDTGRNKAIMLGSLRGSLSQIDKKFSMCTPVVKARWWKAQFHAILGWHAAFVTCTIALFDTLKAISNGGARRIARLHGRCGTSASLQPVKDAHKICLHVFYCKTVAKWVGHCFRHSLHPVSRPALSSIPTGRD